jgi:hypothetical protein
MTVTGSVKYAGAVAALAIWSACGGSAVAPSNAGLNAAYVGRTLAVNGRLVTAARLSSLPRYTAILPDRGTVPRHFEYIINYYGTYASIFDYPTSDQQFGTINDVGGQGCTNVLYGYGKKIAWIVAAYDQITEYEVPETPVKTLSVSYSSQGSPSSCAMNTSGDLAVGILYGSGGGDVVIFKNASGTGKVTEKVYRTPLDEEFFDGYDDKGNLFADGFTGDRSGFALVELPNGSTKFQKIATSNRVEFPGSVQWDGTYLTVTDQDTEEMYQYSVSGRTATLENTISLTGSSDCAQTWIATGIVYCADAGNEDGEVFNYPSGGSAIATFSGNFDLPLGTVASKK